MCKFAATGVIAFLIGLLAWSGTAAAAPADETTVGGASSEAFLSRPGEVVEVEGRASRAIAFFEPGERDSRLTVILTGPALEGVPLRLSLGGTGGRAAPPAA